MLMLLSVCITSIMAIAYVGYNNGRQALYNSIQNQLVSLREVKAAEIENYFETVRSQVQTVSEFGSVVEATKELKVAYQELEDLSLQVTWNDRLKEFYNHLEKDYEEPSFNPLYIATLNMTRDLFLKEKGYEIEYSSSW